MSAIWSSPAPRSPWRSRICPASPSDARAYELSADAAAQDLAKPDIVELHNIHAKVQMQDKSTVEMTAAVGVYDSKGETLKLDRNIVLSSSTGYRGQLSEAMVDVRNGHVVSEQPVEVKLLQGMLNANRLEIVDSGDLVRFDGGVTMTLTAQATTAACRTPKPECNDRGHASPACWSPPQPWPLARPTPPRRAAGRKGPPNALQGFSQNRDQPVHIEAATLEVRDKDKVATFTGDVHVTQGDTDMRCKSLVVFYEQDDAKAEQGQKPESG